MGLFFKKQLCNFFSLQFDLFVSISWCDNLVPNKYGTEVYLTCSLHDARDVIIFQVNIYIISFYFPRCGLSGNPIIFFT